MVEMRASIKGDKALRRKFSKLPEAVRTRGMRYALQAGAKPVVREARRRAPKRPDSGIMAKSIDQETVKDGRGFKVKIGPGKDEGWYGRFVEMGTVHATPHPFLAPSAQERRHEVFGEVRKALWRFLKWEARRR